MATDISIVSSASILVGGNAIVSFEDGSVEAEVASTLYTDTRDDLLVETDWNFNTKLSDALSKLSTAPKDKWAVQYQLPSDTINIIAPSTDIGDYEIKGDKFLTNFDGDVFLNYQYSVDETNFPSYFVSYLKLTLASLFATPIADDPSKAKSYTVLADDKGKSARRTDSKQKRNRRIGGRKAQKNPFTNVRG